MASNDPYAAEVQPLRAGATARYLEAFRAATEQTAATSSTAHPVTADEHLVQITQTAEHVCTHVCTEVPAGVCAKCAVPFSHRGHATDGPYCDYCLNQCRQAGTTALHLCMICR
jgi:glutamine synthetase adenylyltransferase